MERGVIQRTRARIFSRITLCANGRDHERGIVGARDEPMPIEVRLRKLNQTRWFNERRRGQRCGHAGRSFCRNAGMAGRNNQEREGHASSQCQRETDSPTHQNQRNRIVRCDPACDDHPTGEWLAASLEIAIPEKTLAEGADS
jgi:hypothetical protein